MGRWHRYWFADGGRHVIAVLRVAIAFAVWLSLSRLQGTWPANAPGAPEPPDVYRPVGIWMLLGGSPPGNALIGVLWLVARVATVAMAVGLVSRAATAVSFAASVALASLYYSGFPAWSHTYNVVFVAQLALLGARCGDAWSVDAWLRARRGLPPRVHPRGYQWSIRLVQLAVAVMFASGMFHKIMQGHLTLGWALSDSLRHHLLVRFDLAGLERTAVADWIIDDAWKYRTAALLNLIAQTLPLVGCVLVRRPLLRAACGMFFAIETVMLGVVMDLWNLHWLPLVAAFLDWDALRARFRGPDTHELPAGWRPPRVASAFVIAFVVYDVLVAFWPRIDQQLNTYPFSGFPMFANVRARTPYDVHQPYALAGGHFELVADAPLPADAHRWVDHAYRSTFAVRDRRELGQRLRAILTDARRLYPEIRGVRCYYTIFEAPAYPAPARFDRHPIALLGEVHTDGTFRSRLGRARVDGAFVTVTPGDGEGTPTALELYTDDVPAAHPFAVAGPPWELARPRGKKHAYVAVVQTGDRVERWLVATRPK